MGAALVLPMIPTIIQTSEDLALTTARSAMGQERFNQAWNSVPTWLPSPDAMACSTDAGRMTSNVLGYDCGHWDQFNPNIGGDFDADTSENQLEEIAATAAADATFQANFDAAWNAYMDRLNQPPPILRDAQGTPLEPEGPAQVQGFPQRIPKNPGVQTKALPEDEPQRVYNQDDSSEVPELAITESQKPGLPLMTVGIVATGGVLIFLWSTS